MEDNTLQWLPLTYAFDKKEFKTYELISDNDIVEIFNSVYTVTDNHFPNGYVGWPSAIAMKKDGKYYLLSKILEESPYYFENLS